MQQKQLNLNYSSPLDELDGYKEQNRKLKLKIIDLEKKLAMYKHNQQKVKQLEKTNTENSTRLLQCISNVRDLLHSNKNLREQLEREKTGRQKAQTKLQAYIQHSKQKQTKLQSIKQYSHKNQPNKITQKSTPDGSSSPGGLSLSTGLSSIKSKNLHKLSKIQKFAKMKLSSKRMSMDNFQQQSRSKISSPYKHNIPSTLKALAYRYQISPLTVKQQYSPKKLFSSYQNEKKKSDFLPKSVDVKKDLKYQKAMLKRKKSLRASVDKYEELQYKPPIANNL